MDDITRLKKEYAAREIRLLGDDRYSFLNPAYLFMRHQRQRIELAILKKNIVMDCKEVKVLEIGCGRGGILKEYLLYGIKPVRLFGTDLLLDRAIDARQSLSQVPISCADAQDLPYSKGSFDIVLQYTVFSSILDVKIKKNIAKEMLRVLKPNGFIVWYDFWINPQNKQTKGIGIKEIKDLFPGCAYQFYKATLAPPLARTLVPISWEISVLIEAMRIFNSHYFSVIRPL
jgi:ubiquinone/menaquinone biosynthesis C-methylase UbiE